MKKWLWGCGIALAVGVALLAFGAAGIWYVLGVNRPLLASQVDVPREARTGEAFALSVALSNPHPKRVVLDSIDIDESFLAGFQVLAVEPPAAGTMDVALLRQRSWSFGWPVEPGASTSVTFRLRPLRAGHFRGDFDVCNPHQDFETTLLDVVVEGERRAR